MKFDYLALILTFLAGIVIVISPPFVASTYITALIKVPLLVVFTFFFLGIIIKKKNFIFNFSIFIAFYFLITCYWLIRGDNVLGETVYFLIFIILALSLLLGIERIKEGKKMFSNLYLFLVIAFSILSIISFFAYNFDLLPYTETPVGEEAYYTNFFNPVLGYISVKKFELGKLGRVCGFLFEPSYLGWFLTVNFFMLEKYISEKKRLFLFRIVVFFGAMGTCSTMAWIVFPIVFAIKIFYSILSLVRIKKRLANLIFAAFLIFSIFSVFVFVPKQVMIDSLGTSSADEREDRIGTSVIIIFNSSPIDILFGKSPGYIEKNFIKGESNQLLKLLVETGFFSTILVLLFVIYCTRRSPYFMIANLIFLNSVVILFTPLFIINLLVCKWNDDLQDALNT